MQDEISALFGNMCGAQVCLFLIHTLLRTVFCGWKVNNFNATLCIMISDMCWNYLSFQSNIPAVWYFIKTYKRNRTEKKTIITSIWGMRRKGREPEQQTTKFGGEQLTVLAKKNPWRWKKLGSSKNDLCPLGGIFFVWLNVMAAKTSFWLNTLAWSRVHLQSTMHQFGYLDWAWVWMTELWQMLPWCDHTQLKSSHWQSEYSDREQIQEVRSV